MLREEGREDYADQFKGYDWKTEEDAFMDGYHSGNPEVTYERLRAMGNNGVQEPVVGFENGQLVGTKRLYTDGKFTRHGREDGKALFCGGEWRGLQAPGKAYQKDNYRVPDQQRPRQHHLAELVPRPGERLRHRTASRSPSSRSIRRTWPNSGVKAGDLVEVFNDVGATQALVYPTPTARRNETFMVFGAPNGAQGNVDQRRRRTS